MPCQPSQESNPIPSIKATEDKNVVDETIDKEWITSGPLGSHEAVLVFRTGLESSRNIADENSAVVANLKAGVSRNDNLNDALNKRRALFDYEALGKDDSLFANITSSSSALKKCPKDVKVNLKFRFKDCSIRVRHIPSEVIVKTPSVNTKSKKARASPVRTYDSLSSTDMSSDNDDNVAKSCKDFVKAEAEASSSENEKEGSVDSCDPYMPNMPASRLKITYKFMSTETKLLRKVFTLHGLTEVSNKENFCILWAGVQMKPDILRNLTPYQRVNHFPRSYELTRKDRMYKNIERMQYLRGFKHFDIVPQSFIIPSEYKDLVSAHNKFRGPWIIKPTASSRGRGIFIVKSPDEIPTDEQGLVSKYVINPLCIDGHKCDVRVYVLVTSFDPLVIYLYEEGLVRLATVKYDRKVENLWNPCMHLCNYSINKYHSDYIKSNDAQEEDVGHKWTLSALLRHLRLNGCDICRLMSNIEDLIIKSIMACAQSVISACRMFVPNGSNCFELYGFDILIDSTLKPWLLEINLSPSIGVDSPLDAKVKACLITDLLTCVGVPAYTPAMRAQYDEKWSRFRGVNYSRRISTTDNTAGGGNCCAGKRNGGTQSTATSSTAFPPLTLEEQRIVRNAKLQYNRRCGFVRIFPTADSLQRYGAYLDPVTGIPLSMPKSQGLTSMILMHNYNQMLFDNLYGKSAEDCDTREQSSSDERMSQYERALEGEIPISFCKKKVRPKCKEEGKRLCKCILNLINSGSVLTQLQARQTLALYLDAVLHRLSQEPCEAHENAIIKFVNKCGGPAKSSVIVPNQAIVRVTGKVRSAMAAKLLVDFLEHYNRETDAYVDTFDHYGMIPTDLYNNFLSEALESDLGAVLALHTNKTRTMPFLYNRYGVTVPTTPLVPSGAYGFLRALPHMAGSYTPARDPNTLLKVCVKETPKRKASKRGKRC